MNTLGVNNIDNQQLQHHNSRADEDSLNPWSLFQTAVRGVFFRFIEKIDMILPSRRIIPLGSSVSARVVAFYLRRVNGIWKAVRVMKARVVFGISNSSELNLTAYCYTS